MSRWVLLKHLVSSSADGESWHYDWMIEHSPTSLLMTFRIFVRPDDPAITRFVAERIADHRREYLEYEGPISGDRGSVTRIAQGECQIELNTPACLVVSLLTSPPRLLTGQPCVNDPARFDFVASS